MRRPKIQHKTEKSTAWHDLLLFRIQTVRDHNHPLETRFTFPTIELMKRAVFTVRLQINFYSKRHCTYKGKEKNIISDVSELATLTSQNLCLHHGDFNKRNPLNIQQNHFIRSEHQENIFVTVRNHCGSNNSLYEYSVCLLDQCTQFPLSDSVEAYGLASLNEFFHRPMVYVCTI